MLRCMRDVNVDNNTVGWYMSTYMNSWLDPDGPTVATQFQFQDSVPKSVCLVYDPVRTLSGSVHLKAYRLSDRFMAKYRDHQEKQAADKNQHGFTELDIKPKMDYGNKMIDEGITIDDIFEEVPIRIHNSALVMAMLYGACQGDATCALRRRHAKRLPNARTSSFLPAISSPPSVTRARAARLCTPSPTPPPPTSRTCMLRCSRC